LHDSSDVRDPHSLWSELSRRLQSERFAVRIEVVVGLVSLAAVADGVVRVRAGARLGASTARRIALHEVEGHVRPRVSGQLLGGVFVAGSAGASEDEEGRAILLEERAGLLDAERRRELSRRYLAAESTRSYAGVSRRAGESCASRRWTGPRADLPRGLSAGRHSARASPRAGARFGQRSRGAECGRGLVTRLNRARR